MVIPIISLIISSLVAIAVMYREFIHDWIHKPNLEVTFSLDEPISRQTTYRPAITEEAKVFWPRLRVKNNGRVFARKCEAILSEVRNPKGELITRYEPLPLRWAISQYDRGLQPLDIAPKRVVDLNTFWIIEDSPNAFLATEDPIGTLGKSAKLGDYFEPGDYWLRIVIYGDNFQPVERGYAVQWDGKDYKGVKMQGMNERPSDAAHWPWPILEKTESSI